MTDSDQPRSGQTKGAANKRGLRILAVLTVLSSIFIVVILVLMWLTPSDHFFLHFKVKADPLENLSGWFMIRPEAGQPTELFTLAVARAADGVRLASGGETLSGPAEIPAQAAPEPLDHGSALIMVGCVEGRVMPPTFAFSQLVAPEQDNFLPHPPKPCALTYSIDESETLNASCVFDGIVASLIQPPGPRDHLQDAGQILLNSAGQGRRLTIQLSVEAGQALTAHFDVSQLALARVRLQRECGQY